MEEKLYTLNEITKNLHVSIQTLRNRIKDGTLIANKYQRSYIVSESAIKDMLKNTQTGSKKPVGKKKETSKSKVKAKTKKPLKKGKK